MIVMAAMMVTVVARVQVTVTCQLLGHYREPDLVLANVDLGPLLAGDTPSTTTPCCYDPSTGVWTVWGMLRIADSRASPPFLCKLHHYAHLHPYVVLACKLPVRCLACGLAIPHHGKLLPTML